MPMKRLAGLLRRPLPQAPVTREIAPSRMESMLASYIGELPLQPDSPAREAITGDIQADRLQTYRQTLRDERCKAALEQRLNAAVAVPWGVEPGGTADIDRAAAELLERQLKKLKLRRISKQLLHGVWYGWAVAEVQWMRDGEHVGLGGITVRSPDRFWWDEAGELLLRTLKEPDGMPVPDRKFVVLAEPGEHDDLPYAPGLARWCYWPVWMKRNGMQFWAVALERFGTPAVVGKYHPSANEVEQERLLEIIQAAATGTGVAVPEDVMLELLEQKARTGDSFESFQRYCDQLITTVLLGQSSTTDQGPWRGTAEVQKDVRDETVAADVQLLDEALNDTVGRWLTEWNFPGAAVPMIRHDVDPAEDLDARASRELTISQTTGLRPTLEHVQRVYGGDWQRPQGAGESGLAGVFDPAGVVVPMIDAKRRPTTGRKKPGAAGEPKTGTARLKPPPKQEPG